jgi:hypothetical protein
MLGWIFTRSKHPHGMLSVWRQPDSDVRTGSRVNPGASRRNLSTGVWMRALWPPEFLKPYRVRDSPVVQFARP